MIGTGRACERRLLVTADGRDHARPSPARELDRSVADRTGAAGNQHGRRSESTRAKPARPPLRDGETAVRGQRRNAETRADVEREVVGQPHRLTLGQNDVLLRSPVRPLPRHLPEPDALPDARRIDAVADGVDRAGSILIRHDLGKRELPAAAAATARLPVGGIDARDVHGDANLARPRIWNGPLDQAKHLRPARFRVDDPPSFERAREPVVEWKPRA